MEDYTLALALEDFVPVLLSLIGFALLARMVWRVDRDNGRLALVGVTLIGTGGVLKATWKLILALSGRDIAFLDNSLFIFLAPGFACLAWAVWAGQQRLRSRKVAERIWLRPLLIFLPFATAAFILAQQGGRSWVFVLLALTTLKNSILLGNLTRQALWQQQQGIAALFIFNLVSIFALSGLARVEQSVALQWVEQGINTLSQAVFLLAAWRLTSRANQTSIPSMAL